MSEEIEYIIEESLSPDRYCLVHNYIVSLQQKVEQLENIRKEAIELIWGRAYLGEETGEGDLVDWAWLSDNDIEDLLNILNKGSEE